MINRIIHTDNGFDPDSFDKLFGDVYFTVYTYKFIRNIDLRKTDRRRAGNIIDRLTIFR